MINTLFNNRFAETLGWTLVHSLWQLAGIAMLVAVVLKLLARSSAHVRYLVACAGLLLMLTTPLVTFVKLLPAASHSPLITVLSDENINIASSPIAIIAVNATPHPESASSRLRTSLTPWLPLAAGVYVLGVSLMLARLLTGYLHIKKLFAQGKYLEGSIPAQVADLAQRMGVNRLIEVIESSLVEVPTLIGAFKPVILIPASALTGLSVVHLQALLAHEIAHIRRHDYLVNLIQSVVETLLFHHPAVWWLSARIRSEREFCCDDAAIASSAGRFVYAAALTRMETLRAPANLALAASGGSLLLRIRRILRQPATHSPKTLQGSGVAAIVLILLGACGVFAFNRQSSAIEHAKNSPDTLPAHASKPDLNPDVPAESQVSIVIKIIEINNDSIAKLFSEGIVPLERMKPDEAEKTFEKLIKAKEATVLWAPKIIAANRQPAKIAMGQQVPLVVASESDDKKYDVKYDNAGVRFDVKPTLSGEKITLEMELSISKLLGEGIKGNAGNDAPQYFPVIEEHKFKTGVVIQNDETTMIASKSSDPGKTNFFIIHAKIIEPDEIRELIDQNH